MSIEKRFQEFIPTPDLYPNTQVSSDMIPYNTLASPPMYSLFAGAD